MKKHLTVILLNRNSHVFMNDRFVTKSRITFLIVELKRNTWMINTIHAFGWVYAA